MNFRSFKTTFSIRTCDFTEKSLSENYENPAWFVKEQANLKKTTYSNHSWATNGYFTSVRYTFPMHKGSKHKSNSNLRFLTFTKICTIPWSIKRVYNLRDGEFPCDDYWAIHKVAKRAGKLIFCDENWFFVFFGILWIRTMSHGKIEFRIAIISKAHGISYCGISHEVPWVVEMIAYRVNIKRENEKKEQSKT